MCWSKNLTVLGVDESTQQGLGKGQGAWGGMTVAATCTAGITFYHLENVSCNFACNCGDKESASFWCHPEFLEKKQSATPGGGPRVILLARNWETDRAEWAGVSCQFDTTVCIIRPLFEMLQNDQNDIPNTLVISRIAILMFSKTNSLTQSTLFIFFLVDGRLNVWHLSHHI